MQFAIPDRPEQQLASVHQIDSDLDVHVDGTKIGALTLLLLLLFAIVRIPELFSLVGRGQWSRDCSR